MGEWTDLIAYFLGAFGLSLVFVPACRSVARRTGRVARPSADRWHSKPTALMGGVAIFLATMCALAFIHPFRQVALYALTGIGIFIVGFTDDVMPLKPATKLVAQLALASIFVAFDHRLAWLTFSDTLDTAFTVVWIVAITNALNLLDNMDGLCAGIGIIAGLSLLTGLAATEATRPQAQYLAALIGAVAGFLVYNIHPASIFMGDSGSLFIGMTLAGMSIEVPQPARESHLLAVVVAPALILLIPLFDMLLVTAMRTISGRRAWHGGRDHSSHRLVAVGLPEKTAVAVLWTLAAVGGLTAWGIRRMPVDGGILALVLFALAMTLFAVFLTRVRVYEDGAIADTGSGRVTTIVLRFMYKRRVAEVMLDFVLITAAYYAAYRLRFEGQSVVDFFPMFLRSLPIVVGLQLTSFFLMGVYRGAWRQFGMMDAVSIAKAIGLGTLLVLGAILFLFRFENLSRAVFVIDAALILIFATGSRASFRLMAEFVRRRRLGDRLLIYGAGEGGGTAARELLAAGRAPVRLIGFVDDDSQKHGSRVAGYPVLGGYESLAALVEGGAIDQVVVSTILLDRTRLDNLEQLCASSGVKLLRLQVHLESVSSAS